MKRNPTKYGQVVATRCAAWMLLAGTAGYSGPAQAQSMAAIERVRAELEHEPTVKETVTKALKHFSVSRATVMEFYDRNRRYGRVPQVSVIYSDSRRRVLNREDRDLTNQRDTEESVTPRIREISVGAKWSLREIMFNNDEFPVYGLYGVQRDVVFEVARSHYLRRTLLMKLLTEPPADRLERASMEMRVEEYTAVLDALTGNWFSETAKARWYRARLGAARPG